MRCDALRCAGLNWAELGGQLGRRTDPNSQMIQILCCLAEGIHNSSVDESSVAGLESSLSFEADDKMKELPTIKYDQKNVGFEIKGLFCL